MKKKTGVLILSVLLAIFLLAGFVGIRFMKNKEGSTMANVQKYDGNVVKPTTQQTKLEDDFSAVRYEGNYGFDSFLKQGGASSDTAVIKFLTQNNLVSRADKLSLKTEGFGCSTLSVKSPKGDALFGRNFDWQACNALVVSSKPSDGYASVSTVNMDFISAGYGGSIDKLPEKVRTVVALYAPLDGMNEKGLSAAVLMIQDSDNINQNTEKPDITTTTAIRLLLDKAANVDQAINLLKQHDMHASMGLMVHFALADTEGHSVVVEYVDNKMIVTKNPVITNFYLASGEKNGIGTAQSHSRYDILMKQLSKTTTMSMEEVRDAMDSVSKHNFKDAESTEWSVVYNQSSGEVRYYHRENYKKVYTFHVE
ncbi:carcinine hydrolase/isopenicillin-N N-acyltransferase family protein [Clostridium estertheticum]|uniref:carcinine hydrolase/isopenicillin-N N-acyltransferase family protein n=1 Tax=Clostridium estertheticum TaxID=238834 RepID=UPI001C0ACD68|nr:C45 family peptidase [Clostridium estertheticum]MBU3074821.1 linear amide C-N hydrolase [Clostridium estertheticum]MBU3165036.1 linear amide C-N hydrolase [Clostridium estertheticum]MBU3214725.1 linear amide C-N hydrolase [Clostridium estertheticum]WAG57137.1 carcinine hydrolase/isopenicillin-N N-acyltransferase family protein [Clostridium estertheticum]